MAGIQNGALSEIDIVDSSDEARISKGWFGDREGQASCVAASNIRHSHFEVTGGVLGHVAEGEVGSIVVWNPATSVWCLEFNFRDRIVSALSYNVKNSTSPIRIDQNEGGIVTACERIEVYCDS